MKKESKKPMKKMGMKEKKMDKKMDRKTDKKDKKDCRYQVRIMAYEDAPVKGRDTDGKDRRTKPGYNAEIDTAKAARNNTLKDSDPTVEKEGFLGVDNLDKMRRRKVRQLLNQFYKEIK